MDAFAITEGLVPEQNSQDGQDAEKASNTGNLPEGANKFQRAIAAWRGEKSGKALVLLRRSWARD